MDTFLPRVKEYERGEFWTYSHESNFVRLLVILQRGGIYIDSDLIVTKPFAGDFQNSVGHEMPLGMDGGQKVCLFSFSSNASLHNVHIVDFDSPVSKIAPVSATALYM